MRAVLLFTLAAAVSVALAWWVAGLPGSVAVSIAGTSFEARTPVALLLLGVLFVLLYVVIRLVVNLVRLPRRLRRHTRGRNRAKGDAAVNRTLIALAAHDPAAARREADRSRRLLGDTPLTLLLAAQAGRQAGREEEAQQIFTLLATTKQGELLGLRGLLRQAVAAGDWEAAERYAVQAEAAHPGAAWLTEERQRMAVQTGRWHDALTLAGPKGSEPASRAAFAVAAAQAEEEPTAALRLAKQAWETDPALAPAALDYAARLRETGRERAALDVLRRTWSLAPQPGLATAYMEPIAEPMARLHAAQELAEAAPRNPESMLLWAEVAFEAGLTSEARQHAVAARDAGLEDRRVWTLLGAIAERDGDAEAAQEALRQLSNAKPGPGWRCTNCGTVHEAWHPVCDACGSAGRIAWTASDVAITPPQPQAPATIEGFG